MSEEIKKFTFDSFNLKAVQTLSLDQLRQTHKENYPDGTPVGGIYHFNLFDSLLGMLDAAHISYEIDEIFAANNKFKRSPGVTILPEVEMREGVGSLQSHILRRVFANIRLTGDFANKDNCYNIAVSYTQLGILIGMGPYTYACHNQTICRAERLFSNYTLRGHDRLSTDDRSIKNLLLNVKESISQLPAMHDEDTTALNALKERTMSEKEVLEFIGMMVRERCITSSANPLNRENRITPLNSAEINSYTDKLLSEKLFSQCTAYDLYQAGTFFMKPDTTPFENIAMQSFALFQMLVKYVNG